VAVLGGDSGPVPRQTANASRASEHESQRRRRYPTREAATRAIGDYIDNFYNVERATLTSTISPHRVRTAIKFISTRHRHAVHASGGTSTRTRLLASFADLDSRSAVGALTISRRTIEWSRQIALDSFGATPSLISANECFATSCARTNVGSCAISAHTTSNLPGARNPFHEPAARRK
jgi:hypothetical protein